MLANETLRIEPFYLDTLGGLPFSRVERHNLALFGFLCKGLSEKSFLMQVEMRGYLPGVAQPKLSPCETQAGSPSDVFPIKISQSQSLYIGERCSLR